MIRLKLLEDWSIPLKEESKDESVKVEVGFVEFCVIILLINREIVCPALIWEPNTSWIVLLDTMLLVVAEINDAPTISCEIVAANNEISDGILSIITPFAGIGLVLRHLRVIVVKE